MIHTFFSHANDHDESLRIGDEQYNVNPNKSQNHCRLGAKTERALLRHFDPSGNLGGVHIPYHPNTFHYDLIVNNKKIDVKGTDNSNPSLLVEIDEIQRCLQLGDLVAYVLCKAIPPRPMPLNVLLNNPVIQYEEVCWALSTDEWIKHSLPNTSKTSRVPLDPRDISLFRHWLLT